MRGNNESSILWLAKFIPSDKKILTSAVITATYNVGEALVATLFLLFKEHLVDDWR